MTETESKHVKPDIFSLPTKDLLEATERYAKLNRILIGYGLTINQAKIIASLTIANCCLSVKQISRISKIPRESIYGCLHALAEMGLIENQISKPKKFCTIPLKRILEMLHDEKNQEIHQLEELTTQVLSENQNSSISQFSKDSKFILIPRKRQLVETIGHAIYNSKRNVKIKTSWKRHLQSMIVHEKVLRTSISNGVKFQVFITMNPNQDELPEKARFFHSSPNVSTKFAQTPSKMVFIIIDDREIFLMTKPQSDLTQSPALWSNNQSIVTALSTCFDHIWGK